MEADAVRLELLRDHLGDPALRTAHDTILLLDHGDVQPAAAESFGHLQPNVATTDDHSPSD